MTTMARTKQQKVEPKKHTSEEEAQFEVAGREWEVSNCAARIDRRLDDAEYRLRRTLEEIARIRESDWRTLEQKGGAVAHELAWLMPNMGLEYLIGEALDMAKARQRLDVAKANLAALAPETTTDPIAEPAVEEA
jgi:hypothetical protein